MRHRKCVRVEWDLNHSGGEYVGVGEMAYISLMLISNQPGPLFDVNGSRLKSAFVYQTGVSEEHIVHIDLAVHYTEDGELWQDSFEFIDLTMSPNRVGRFR